MKKPIIGVTSGENTIFKSDSFSGKNVSYTLTDVTDAVLAAGGIPMIIPVHQPNLSIHYINSIDGLILTGGVDVLPEFYGEVIDPLTKKTDAKRDTREFSLIKAALKQKLPILGICRGMQLMNVYLGGSLHQDITQMNQPTRKHDYDEGWSDISHPLHTDKQSRIGQLLNRLSHTGVNSLHHQSVKTLSRELNAVAWSSDGVIEAVESKNPQIDFVGVQYHPESLFKAYPEHLTLFEDLISRIQFQKTVTTVKTTKIFSHFSIR